MTPARPRREGLSRLPSALACTDAAAINPASRFGLKDLGNNDPGALADPAHPAAGITGAREAVDVLDGGTR
jgi:hypothetical protein